MGLARQTWVKILVLGVPWWLSGLGHCHGTVSIPGPGTSACHRGSQKKKKKNAKFTMYWLSSFVILSKSLDLSVSQLFQR